MKTLLDKELKLYSKIFLEEARVLEPFLVSGNFNFGYKKMKFG